jgi:hypothetical protein
MAYLYNIEKSRNTELQLTFYKQFEEFVEKHDLSIIEQMASIPLYSSRLKITDFVEKYEFFKLCQHVPGCIIECSVLADFGLMTFAHFCSIFEPYYYVVQLEAETKELLFLSLVDLCLLARSKS